MPMLGPPRQPLKIQMSIAHELSGSVPPGGGESMNRATWLQGRRMQKFRNVLGRWERRELSMMEAGELLGMSERQFRRYRERFEEEGEAALVDRRLGKPSPRRIEADEIDRMLQLYRTTYRGWNV